MSSDTSGIDHWLKSLITYRSYILKEGTVDFEWAMCDVSAEGSPKNLRKPFFPVKCDFTQIFGLRTESYLSFFNNVSHPKFCGSVLFFTLGRRVQQMTCCCASLISYFFQELISHKYHFYSFGDMLQCIATYKVTNNIFVLWRNTHIVNRESYHTVCEEYTTKCDDWQLPNQI